MDVSNIAIIDRIMLFFVILTQNHMVVTNSKPAWCHIIIKRLKENYEPVEYGHESGITPNCF